MCVYMRIILQIYMRNVHAYFHVYTCACSPHDCMFGMCVCMRAHDYAHPTSCLS